MNKINYFYYRYFEKLMTLYSLFSKKLKRWDTFAGQLDNWGVVFLSCEKRMLDIFWGPDSLESTVTNQIEITFQKLKEITKEANVENIQLPLECMCEKYKLNMDEKTILIFLFFKKLECRVVHGISLLKLITSPGALFDKIEIFSCNGTLRSSELIESLDYLKLNSFILNERFQITNNAFWTILGKDGEKIESQGINKNNEKTKNVSMLTLKSPDFSLNQLVLDKEIKFKIENVLWQYENGDQIYKQYGIYDKLPYGKGITMLFHGPSGTGKTATSEAIAKKINKKIGIVNYAQIYDCWVGNSEKNIKRVFEEAKENDCVLLFDEAEAMFSERFIGVSSIERMHNLMTNTLMQEFEKFSGIIILTTNREDVIDAAFDRRILLKLKFDLPSADIRAEIWELFLKGCPNLSPDVSFSELGRRYSFTGGKIKNVVIKTIMKCAPKNTQITMPSLIESANEELNGNFFRRRALGFKC